MAGKVPTTRAATDVLTERERQKSVEGWTLEHDDEHDGGELAQAAGVYAMHAGSKHNWIIEDYQLAGESPEGWPWAVEWWKPKNPRRDLVRAAALILAEIERIDRAAAPEAPR